MKHKKTKNNLNMKKIDLCADGLLLKIDENFGIDETDILLIHQFLKKTSYRLHRIPKRY